MIKTNAMRILETEGIKFKIHEYDTTDGKIDGVSVAAKIGCSADMVYKTLVTNGKRQFKKDCQQSFLNCPMQIDLHNTHMSMYNQFAITTGINVFVVPVDCELNLKKAAFAAGDKSVEMIKSKDLEPQTGYIHGGCSPVGMKKQFPTYIEETAELLDTMVVSAGKIGLQVELSPQDLVKAAGAKFADLV